MKLTLDSMETLDAIDRHGSFAAAAKALHKVQSAVSYNVAKLESDLGISLFDRSGHRAVFTDVGRAVLEEGRFVLARARGIESLAERLSGGWEPRLFVVIDGILPLRPIMRVLGRLAGERVPTRIQIKMEFLGGVQDRFERDDADIMLAKAFTDSQLLVTRPLPDVTAVLVVHRSHPLAAPDAPVELVDLHRHVELTVHDSSDSSRVVDNRIFGGSRVFFLSDFNTKKEAILSGLGFGWMPVDRVESELSAGELVEVPYTAGSRFSFTPHLVHPTSRPLGQAGSRFAELLEFEW